MMAIEEAEAEPTREDLARAMQEAIRASRAAASEAARYRYNVDTDDDRARAALDAANAAEAAALVTMWRTFYALP